jgi:hypothetical protein
MLSLIITTLLIRAARKLGRGENVLLRLYAKFAHMTGAFFVAVEGHMFCRYVWPFFYPLVFWVQAHTGIDLSGFEY